MSVYKILLADCLDGGSPPEKALRLSIVGDTVFIAIDESREMGDTVTSRSVADIAVSSASLREALELLDNDQKREDTRPLDPPGNTNGERGATLQGRRIGWVKV